MSGRLIILPKKSYCPWKPENVEKVLRDERLERERLQQEEAQERQLESTRRLATLKGGTASTIPTPDEHVNLFPQEHQSRVGEKNPDKKHVGIMPVRLDSVVQKQDEPFYVRPNRRRDSQHDERTKTRMDPMKAFVRPIHTMTSSSVEKKPERHGSVEEASRSGKRGRSSRRSSDESLPRRESSRRHDRKRRKRDSSKSSSSTKDTAPIEELRHRRQERERTESQREAAALRRNQKGNDRTRRYQDQFNPGLSRR